MKKAEFLKNENVPQFIKDLLADAPDDAEIGMEVVGIKGGKKSTASKQDGVKCEGCEEEYKDGIAIAPHIVSLATQLENMSDIADCKGRIRKEDIPAVRSMRAIMVSTLDVLEDLLRINGADK